MRLRPVLHETEAETKTNYCETETETNKAVLRPRWSRDLNIPGNNAAHVEQTVYYQSAGTAPDFCQPYY